MGHAGAIISGGEGTAQEKIEALQAVGVRVAELPTDIARLVKESHGRIVSSACNIMHETATQSKLCRLFAFIRDIQKELS
jgi:hypothetical protein